MSRRSHPIQFSLKWRFTIGLAALLLLTISALGWLVLREIKLDQQQKVETDLKQRSELASLRVRQIYLSGSALDDVPTFLRRRGTELAADLSALLNGTHVMLYDSNGKEIGNSMPLSGSADVKDIMVYAKQGKIVYEQSGDSLIYLAPIIWSVGQVGIVQLQLSLKADQAFYSSIALSLRNIGLAALAVSFLLGFIYVQRVTSALRKLRAAADQIRAGHYIGQSPIRRRDELGELSEGITYMSREIEQSLARQKQFIGSVSHEFKTPLTSIIAYSDLLDMYRDDPKLLDEAIVNIRQEADRLLEMVVKVLHLSEMEQYEFSLHAENLDVQESLNAVCSRLRGKAAQFNISIETDLEAAMIRADRESFMHIFLNLLDNAIKYNVPGGSIHIKCRADSNKAVIVIRDTGIGIPEEARAKLFEPFYTVSKDRARLSGGTGLGLSLVKRLVELQQGTVVYSEPPSAAQGSQFTVTFPLLSKKNLQA
ncbi:sensor histidine kinase [Paenibacillus baekrokdamisoli]|uniref:histidine kinase n=1 Tax=Paenibacillus baekrokdamisoli TaxID=1712516 RepID=A0A3G9JA01_9BACL|nr:sensor histidine kinase [Paenibacillus baekrokdamisoli]MBB3073041.1 signal transduction histidine kinase [Paenibacillus baekrokdamisoli]BBH21723.1 sensor histidine kinase [Paenibacillus baekrokdamisoli]